MKRDPVEFEFTINRDDRPLLRLSGWGAHLASFAVGVVLAPVLLFMSLSHRKSLDLREDPVLIVVTLAWVLVLLGLAARGLWTLVA